MVDARIQIKELLEGIEYEGLKVSMGFPKKISYVPLITLFEITNSSTGIKVRDLLAYQIDCWAENFEAVIDIMQLVDEQMVNLGFKRDYVSKDEDAIDASGYYRKILRYSSYVDTRTNRLIR